MPVDAQQGDFVVQLYETPEKPPIYQYFTTRKQQEERVSAFQRGGRFYRIWWGICRTEIERDWDTFGEWWRDDAPKTKSRGQDKR